MRNDGAMETMTNAPAVKEAAPPPGLLEQAIHHNLYHFLIGVAMMVSGWIAKLGRPPDPENPLTEPLQRLLASMMASGSVLQYLGFAALVVGAIRSILHVVRVRRERTRKSESKAEASATGWRGGR